MRAVYKKTIEKVSYKFFNYCVKEKYLQLTQKYSYDSSLIGRECNSQERNFKELYKYFSVLISSSNIIISSEVIEIVQILVIIENTLLKKSIPNEIIKSKHDIKNQNTKR